MKARIVQDSGEHPRTFVLAFEKGDDAVRILSEFARAQQLGASQITGVGALQRAVLGYFDRSKKDYRRIRIDEQAEVLSLIGDVAHEGETPVVHLHGVLGLADATTRGGHILEAIVWPTLEVMLTEYPRHVQKRFDPDVGLALLDPTCGHPCVREVPPRDQTP